MKINLNQMTEREGTIQTGGTFIAPSLTREREYLDKNGNVIDPRTKQIIRKVEDQ